MKFVVRFTANSKTLMIRSFLLLLTTLLVSASFAQSDRSVFLEIAGSGGLGSVNYEKVFRQTDKMDITWRAGLSLAPIDKNNGTGIVFPVMINALLGKESHKWEAGLGQGLTITTKGNAFALTTAILGYRYMPPDKKIYYRVTYTPLISYLIDFQVQQWAGLSIGYRLNPTSK